MSKTAMDALVEERAAQLENEFYSWLARRVVLSDDRPCPLDFDKSLLSEGFKLWALDFRRNLLSQTAARFKSTVEHGHENGKGTVLNSVLSRGVIHRLAINQAGQDIREEALRFAASQTPKRKVIRK